MGDGRGAQLDNASLAALCRHLDARTLVALQLANRQTRRVASDDAVWRQKFESDFPYYYAEALRRAAGAWQAEYAQRQLHDQRWKTGSLARPRQLLRGHTGTVFGATFLGPPGDGSLPGGLALSGGITGDGEGAELIAWDLTRSPCAATAQLGWRLRAAAGGRGVPSGAWNVHQVPGTAQVVCTSLGTEVDVVRLQRAPATAPAAAGADDVEWDGGGSGGSGDVAAAQAAALRAGGADAGPEVSSAQRDTPHPASGYDYRVEYTLVGHDSGCPSCRVHGQRTVFTASFDGTMKLFTLPDAGDAGGAAPDRGPQRRPRLPLPVHASATFTDAAAPAAPAAALHLGQNRGVCGLVVSEDASRIVSGGNDMQVKAWDAATRRVVLRVTGHQGWIWHVEALGEGMACVVTGSTDGTARVWDLRAGRQAGVLNFSQRHRGSVFPVGGLAVKPDQRYLAAGCFDGAVHVADLRALRVMGSLEGHSDRVARLALEGDTLLSCSFDSTVGLWQF